MQLLKDYYYCYNNAKLIKMLNLKDSQDKQEVEEVQDKQRIKSVIYYLVKQASQLLEYNSYKLASHLTNALKAITNFKRKLKQKKT